MEQETELMFSGSGTFDSETDTIGMKLEIGIWIQLNSPTLQFLVPGEVITLSRADPHPLVHSLVTVLARLEETIKKDMKR